MQTHNLRSLKPVHLNIFTYNHFLFTSTRFRFIIQPDSKSIEEAHENSDKDNSNLLMLVQKILLIFNRVLYFKARFLDKALAQANKDHNTEYT